MTKLGILLSFIAAFAVIGVVSAASITVQPGDTVHCSTVFVGSGQDVACATPVPTPTPLPTATPLGLTWAVPSGITSIRQSAGYEPFTSPGIDAFFCPQGLGWYRPSGPWSVWLGQDDDNTYAVVKFPQPVQFSGLQWQSLATSGGHFTTGYLVIDQFSWSADDVTYTPIGNVPV